MVQMNGYVTGNKPIIFYYFMLMFWAFGVFSCHVLSSSAHLISLTIKSGRYAAMSSKHTASTKHHKEHCFVLGNHKEHYFVLGITSSNAAKLCCFIACFTLVFYKADSLTGTRKSKISQRKFEFLRCCWMIVVDVYIIPLVNFNS